MIEILYPILFLSEIYLFITHGLVLTRVYQPSNNKLKGMGMWFLYDGLSGFSILFVLSDLIGSFYSIIVILHLFGHLFYVVTWTDGYYAKRIRDWSSIEYSKEKHLTIDFFLTIFDMSVHLMNGYYLYHRMVGTQYTTLL